MTRTDVAGLAVIWLGIPILLLAVAFSHHSNCTEDTNRDGTIDLVDVSIQIDRLQKTIDSINK